MANQIKIELTVDDKGTAKVTKFTDKTVSKVRQMSNKSIAHARKMSRAIAKIGGAFTKVIAKAGMLTAKVAGLGLALAGAVAGFTLKKSIGEFANFESALVDMSKVTDESLDQIKQKIMSLPPELGSATDMVKGYYQVISAGVTEPAAAMETLKTASMAAKAAHVEQSEVIKGLTKVMAGYQGEIKTTAEAADLLFTIEKEGQTSFQELIPVIGGLAAMSHDLGVSQDEMGASLALITQTAGSTAEAATQYQAVLTGLMKPTTEMTGFIKAMGYESAQAMIQEQGLTQTLKDLKEYTGGSAEKMNELFGRVEAVKGMSALAAEGFGKLTEKVSAMKDKTGALEKAWENYKGTLSAMWDTFKNTVGKQAILIGEKLAPAIKKVLEHAGEWLKKNRELITSKVAEWVEWLQIKIESILPQLKQFWEGLGYVLKFTGEVAKGFHWLGEQIGIVAAKIVGFYEKVVGFYEKVKSLALKPIKLIADFVGRGSSEAPLSDKIQEMDEKIKSFFASVDGSSASTIVNIMGNSGTGEKYATEALQDVEARLNSLEKTARETTPEIKVETASAEEKVEGLEGKWKTAGVNIENFMPKVNLDVSPAMRALEGVQTYYNKLISGMYYGMATTTGMGYYAQLTRENLAKGIAQAEGQLSYAESALGGYQAGTGPRGLPYTGPFYGHKGEIILNPGQSERLRQIINTNTTKNESTSSIKMGDIIINVPEPDVSPAMRALEGVQTYYNKLISGMYYGMATTTGMGYYAQLTRENLAKGIAQAEGQLSYAESALGGYQAGTGPRGLPYTGPFYGHKGEIILNPGQSERLRQIINTNTTKNESTSSIKMGDIIINVPEPVAIKNKDNLRRLVREGIIPELNKVFKNLS